MLLYVACLCVCVCVCNITPYQTIARSSCWVDHLGVNYASLSKLQSFSFHSLRQPSWLQLVLVCVYLCVCLDEWRFNYQKTDLFNLHFLPRVCLYPLLGLWLYMKSSAINPTSDKEAGDVRWWMYPADSEDGVRYSKFRCTCNATQSN